MRKKKKFKAIPISKDIGCQSDTYGDCNRCVCCGAPIPEGKQICPKCESLYDDQPSKIIGGANGS